MSSAFSPRTRSSPERAEGRTAVARGSVSLVVLFLFFIFSGLGLSMIYLSQVHIRMNAFRKSSLFLDYASENGLKRGLEDLAGGLGADGGAGPLSESALERFREDPAAVFPPPARGGAGSGLPATFPGIGGGRELGERLNLRTAERGGPRHALPDPGRARRRIFRRPGPPQAEEALVARSDARDPGGARAAPRHPAPHRQGDRGGREEQLSRVERDLPRRGERRPLCAPGAGRRAPPPSPRTRRSSSPRPSTSGFSGPRTCRRPSSGRPSASRRRTSPSPRESISSVPTSASAESTSRATSTRWSWPSTATRRSSPSGSRPANGS